MRIQSAQYRGQDNHGRPFVLNARSALQQSSSMPVVDISDMHAADHARERPGASARAARAATIWSATRSTCQGPILFTAADGYRLGTRDVHCRSSSAPRWRAAVRSRAGCRSDTSPPTGSTSTCPSAGRAQRPRPLAYRPGECEMSGTRLLGLAGLLLGLVAGQAALGQVRPVPRSRVTTPTRRSTSPPTGSRCRTAPTAPSSRAMSRSRQGDLHAEHRPAHRRLCQCRRHRDRAARSERRRHPAQPVRNRAQPISPSTTSTGGW